jgi:hypothetical protein
VQSFTEVKDVSRTSDAISHWDAFPLLSATPKVSPQTLVYGAGWHRNQLTHLGRIQSTLRAPAEFISYASRDRARRPRAGSVPENTRIKSALPRVRKSKAAEPRSAKYMLAEDCAAVCDLDHTGGTHC